MTLEHLIIASDFQDWGLPKDCVRAIECFRDFVEQNYDPNSTRVQVNGDLLDLHAISNLDKIENSYRLEGITPEIEDQFRQFLDKKYEESKEGQNDPEKKQKEIDSELKSQLRGKVINKYVLESMSTIKSLSDKGYKVTGVTGNNEYHVLLNLIPPSENPDLGEIDKTIRQIYSQRGGIETIDDFKMRDFEGLNVLSFPYINDIKMDLADYSAGNDHVAKKIKESVKEIAPNAIMLHGNPQVGENAELINNYLRQEYSGDTLWVFSGHRGAPGVEGRINKNGSKVIYVNTNTVSSVGQTFFDAHIENSKIKGIKRYEMQPYQEGKFLDKAA